MTYAWVAMQDTARYLLNLALDTVFADGADAACRDDVDRKTKKTPELGRI